VVIDPAHGAGEAALVAAGFLVVALEVLL